MLYNVLSSFFKYLTIRKKESFITLLPAHPRQTFFVHKINKINKVNEKCFLVTFSPFSPEIAYFLSRFERDDGEDRRLTNTLHEQRFLTFFSFANLHNHKI